MVKFHVRGGPKLRKAFARVQKAKTAKYVCPSCSKKSVKRITVGMWKCKSCDAEFAGGAYELSTPTGKLSQRLIFDLNKKGAISKEEIAKLEMEIEKAEDAAGSFVIEGEEAKKE